MESNEEILKAIYLFTNFTKDELHNLGSKAKHIVLNPRDVLFSEGNEASSFYVVRYGTLKILTHTRQGDDVALTTIGAGDYFGELPFLFHEKRSATVEAIEKTELLEFSYADLQSVLSRNVATELKFYKEISSFLAKKISTLTVDLTYAREIKKKFS